MRLLYVTNFVLINTLYRFIYTLRALLLHWYNNYYWNIFIFERRRSQFILRPRPRPLSFLVIKTGFLHYFLMMYFIFWCPWVVCRLVLGLVPPRLHCYFRRPFGRNPCFHRPCIADTGRGGRFSFSQRTCSRFVAPPWRAQRLYCWSLVFIYINGDNFL